MSNNLNITALTDTQVDKVTTINDIKGSFDAAITEALTFTWAGAETNKSPTTAELRSNVAFVFAGSTSGTPTFKLNDGVERGIVMIKNDLAKDVAVSSETPAIAAVTVLAGTVAFIYFNGIEVYAITQRDTVDWHTDCRVATTANITIATALNSGDTIDGVVLAGADRVLVKNQSSTAENGIYVVDAVPFRALDADASGELRSSSAVAITAGTVNAGRNYILNTSGTIIPGTTPHTWVVFGAYDLMNVIQTEEMIPAFIETAADKSYKIIVKAKHAGTITEVTTISSSGTCTLTVKINTTALGGTANSVSNMEQSQAHSSSNAFAAGDDIVLVVSANAAALDVSVGIKYTRTYQNA